MDAGALTMLIPVLALGIGLVVVIKMPRKAFGRTADRGVEDRLLSLEGAVQDLREQLTDTQERLDFAERLLRRPEEATGPRRAEALGTTLPP
jgi:hypothetical protein